MPGKKPAADAPVVNMYMQISRVMAPALAQFEPLMSALNAGIPGEQSVQEMIQSLLWSWAQQLVDPEMAPYPTFVAKDLVRVAFNDYPPVDFWRTELGQVVLHVDGFPERPASRNEAAVILGMTPPAVLKAIRRGDLRIDHIDQRLVTRKSLMAYYRLRRTVMAARAMAKEEIDD